MSRRSKLNATSLVKSLQIVKDNRQKKKDLSSNEGISKEVLGENPNVDPFLLGLDKIYFA